MDNQNNNFENINHIPREPDFPPKEQQNSRPDNQEVTYSQPEFQENIPEQNNSASDFTEESQPVSSQYYHDNTGIPDIPPEGFKGEYNNYSQQSSQNGQAVPPQYYNNTGYAQPNFNNGQNFQQQNVYNSAYNQNNQPYYGNPSPYMQNNPAQAQQNPYGNNAPVQYPGCVYPVNNQNQPKKGKNTGLKVFLICLSIVFGICLMVFVGMISYSMGQSTGGYTSSTGSTMPTEYYSQNNSSGAKVHEESDYSDKINPSYEGLELQEQVKDKDSGKYTAEYSYEAVSKSVVGVICYADEVTEVSQCTTQGSGIIISEDGYIVTNAHIVNNSKTAYAIQVITSDGTDYDAGVVGVDSRTDLAVLKIDGKGLTPATFGKSEDMVIGSSVIAIGNPGGIGYQNSLTSGIVSALNRAVPSSTNVKYIQTDAAINPGNSGGPLCNLYGQVIGINTSKIVSEKYEGMGFAIPSETVKEIADQLIKQGYVSGRVKLGVVGVAVSSAQKTQYNLPGGIIVQSVEEGGPLSGSGIQQDDIITKVDGESVSTFGEVYDILEKHKAGDTVTVEVYRSPYVAGEEKTFEVEAVLAEAKD